jgi:Ni,Fe-hydrogenase III large subunit
MIHLTKALAAALDNDFVFDDTLGPSSVTCCVVPLGRFGDAAPAMARAYALLAAEWAADETPFGRGYGIYACYRLGREYLVVRADVPADRPEFPSITGAYVAAYRFERQIHSLMGLVPFGHPDLRPWIKFEDWPEDAWPLRKSFDPLLPLPRVPGEYAWARAEGEGVYEIPVGPVHAGIIEPGHFRFQAVGELIVNLEERLGYVHKGIEKRFEALGWDEGARLAGRVSGDTTVAHAIAYAMAVEATTRVIVPDRAHWVRALLLERERIANHIGDLGMICNDAAFAFMLFQLSRLKEMLLRTNMRLFGHRMMMDRVVPGGVTVDIDEKGAGEIRAELDSLSIEFERLVRIYDDNASLDDRLRDTGVLSSEKARELCSVGVVARASGLNLDCRLFHPFPPYDTFEVNVPVLVSGDVHARAWVRVEEVRESIRIVRHILDNIPGGRLRVAPGSPAAETSGFSAVEGWRGEIIYWVQAGPRGELNRCMVRDPSSLDWLGLEQAIPGNIVPDFPLCNKSFNQSYSGHDL